MARRTDDRIAETQRHGCSPQLTATARRRSSRPRYESNPLGRPLQCEVSALVTVFEKEDLAKLLRNKRPRPGVSLRAVQYVRRIKHASLDDDEQGTNDRPEGSARSAQPGA